MQNRMHHSFNVMTPFPLFMLPLPATTLTNDYFFPSFYMQPTILPIILFVCHPKLIDPRPTI
jgi:hypothetical protein